jgi:DNA-binding CsgD family transcriptional regulator
MNHDQDPLANALRLLRGPVPDALLRLPLPIWIADTTGHVRWMNVAASSLFRRRVGTHFTRFIAPDGVGDARELFARKILGALDETVQRTTLDTAAGEAAAEMTSVPIKDEGRIVGVITLIRVERARTGRRRPKPRLTPRQNQVLQLLAQGLTTTEIAERLGLTIDTTRNHIRLLMVELRVRTRLEAVVIAFRNDWL